MIKFKLKTNVKKKPLIGFDKILLFAKNIEAVFPWILLFAGVMCVCFGYPPPGF